MKKPYRGTYSILIVLFVFTFSLIIINSCKKDIKASAQVNINNTAMVTRAKQWYEGTYPVKPVALQSGHQLNSINDTTGGLSRFAHPDWQNNNVYLRYADSVIEMPIDPSDKIKTALGNGGAGYNYNINYTRSSFILLKNGSNYSAYVMTIIADSAYLKNDLGKLALNTYRKRDTAFSGLVLYFTPKGKFVSGFKYSKGHLVIPAAQNSNSTQVQAIKHKAAGTPRTDVAAPAGNCEDWYFVIYSIATLDIVYSQYEYTICDPAPSTDGGGAAPAPPPPCKLPTTLPDNIGRAPVIFGNAPPSNGPTTGPGDGNGGGDDDGGMPPPTTDICAKVVAVFVDTLKDPCAQAAVLAANQAFIDKMNYLKSIMNTPGETTDIMEPDGTFNQQVSALNGGTDQNFSITSVNGSTGFLHNHGKGTGILSVYSPDDLASLHNIIKYGNVANPATYTFGLVNQDGQSYLLTVTDMSKFDAWANTYTTNNTANSILKSVYNTFVKPSNTDASNENNFVSFLQSTNSGLTLMKGNTANTTWSTVVKNSDGSYSVIPCSSK